MEVIESIFTIAKDLYSLCKAAKANKKSCENLANRVSNLEMIVTALKEKGNPELAKNFLSELCVTLESAVKVVTRYASRNFWRGMLKAHDIGQEFESLNNRLSQAGQGLQLALQVDGIEMKPDVLQEVKGCPEQDRVDRESDIHELIKLLKGKLCLKNTQEDMKDMKDLLKLLDKPNVFLEAIREIKPEELSYDLPKKPIMKSANSEMFKGEYNKSPVAIKRYACTMDIKPSVVRNTFIKEVATMRRFESQNILRMFGICIQGEDGPNQNYLIIMEYCERGSLREVLDSRPDLNWNRKACMSLGAAHGLYRLHQTEEKFSVHGCMNSSMFLVTESYTVKLGGFELAKTETSLRRTTVRKNNSLCYSSPQQLENINHPYDKACEMYSFGIVLWEIATFKRPFKDRSNEDIFRIVCTEKDAESLPGDCPKQLGDLINACRSYDSFYRPNAGVLVDKLRMAAGQLTTD